MAVREYTVRIEPHGRSIAVRENRPVLEAALEAGLNLPRSCRSGHCGSCRARLMSGTVHYPNGAPLGLMEEEAAAGDVLLCQAVPRSCLVVDARLIADVADVEIKTLPCRVARLMPLGPQWLRLILRLPAVESLDLRPGQQVDLLFADGRRRRLPAVLPPPDPHSIELRLPALPDEGLREGDLLRIEGPMDPDPH